MEVLLRFCALLSQSRQLPDALIGHLKEMAFREDQAMVSAIRNSRENDMLSSLRSLAVMEAKSMMDNLFEGETLESAHLSASLATAKLFKNQNTKFDGQALVYGEVEFDPFVKILDIATKGLSSNGKFVDLGHGIGRAAIIAALVTDFRTVAGYELLGALHNKSETIVKRFYRQMDGLPLSSPCFDLKCGSFLAHDNVSKWIDADLVFTNSTCFPDHLLAQIEELCKRLRPGARIITFSSRLQSREDFHVLYQERLYMSWGYATVFVHERRHNNEMNKGQKTKAYTELDKAKEKVANILHAIQIQDREFFASRE
jgi:SAM-dependent methyltransferase